MTTISKEALKKELESMLKSAVHFGHATAKWNPKMKKYLFGQRQGIHIFDLRKTFEALDNALLFIKKLVADGRMILFVNTKQQAIDLVTNIAKETGMPYVNQKWIGGLLTNFQTIKKRIKCLLDLEAEERAGGFDKYTKKEALQLKNKIAKLRIAFGGLTAMTRLPDALFVLDVAREKTSIAEASRLSIPIIGICDTDADPEKVDYPIPANDDSVKSLSYVLGKVLEAVSESRKKK